MTIGNFGYIFVGVMYFKEGLNIIRGKNISENIIAKLNETTFPVWCKWKSASCIDTGIGFLIAFLIEPLLSKYYSLAMLIGTISSLMIIGGVLINLFNNKKKLGKFVSFFM